MTRRDADNREVETPAAAGGGTGSSTRRRGLTTAGWAAKRRLDVVHRVGAAGLGVALWVFGILGLVNRLALFSHHRRAGVEPLLQRAAVGDLARGGRRADRRGGAWRADRVDGDRGGRGLVPAFRTGELLVLGTPLNLLAFGMPNVIFSLLAGAVLLFLGAYGRFTGGLPPSNPYQHERHDRDDEQERVPLPTIFSDPADVRAATELAEAERADARRATSPAQITGLAAAHQKRRARTGSRDGAPRPSTDNPPVPTVHR